MWRGAIQAELDKLDTDHSMDDLEISSMIWFVITDTETDQSTWARAATCSPAPQDRSPTCSNYRDAGLTMPMLWPPFADVPVSKTMDDMKQLEEIMPKVNEG